VLELTDLRVHYGNVAAVDGVSVTVEAGEIVAIIGPNGAGKTSALRALSGLVRPSGGRVVFRGTDISRWRPHRIVALGLSHAPEGRRLFPQMSVLENLRMGAYRRRDRQAITRSLGEVLERFPRLAERRHQRAGTLSGGEQQMLTIGRALMSEPTMLVLDEPSFGLAPLIVREIRTIVQSINRDRKVAVLLVEQNARMETGRIVLSGSAAALRESPHVRAAYLGG